MLDGSSSQTLRHAEELFESISKVLSLKAPSAGKREKNSVGDSSSPKPRYRGGQPAMPTSSSLGTSCPVAAPLGTRQWLPSLPYEIALTLRHLGASMLTCSARYLCRCLQRQSDLRIREPSDPCGVRCVGSSDSQHKPGDLHGQ